MLGRISNTMMWGPLSPRSRAAATYSRSRSISTAERTVRAISGVKMMPITRITLRGERPSEASTSTTRMISGKAEQRIDEPAEDVVHPAPVVAGEQPQRECLHRFQVLGSSVSAGK